MYMSYYTRRLFLIFLILWAITICFFLHIKNGGEPKIKFMKWFFARGVLYPEKPKHPVPLLYDQDQGDRIVEQLLYIPPDYNISNVQKKTILSHLWIDYNNANNLFAKCPVSKCTVTGNINEAASSDAIIFTDPHVNINYKRSAEQIWIIYLLECPHHTQKLTSLNRLINWTATYRRDSDIVTPYEKWVYYDEEVIEKPQSINYAKEKVKKVAWFVSNCQTSNNRIQYAKELQNYISVDIYGACGQLSCPRHNSSNCFKLVRQYKFYLAFENSNCHDYITEKFFVNALSNDVVPIVMGPNKEDYIKVAPKNSFIHVNDFKNPKALAEYLNYLDGDEKAYNSFFEWKGTGEFVNTYFWCRLCAMLHSPYPKKSYDDLEGWWRGPGVCTM